MKTLKYAKYHKRTKKLKNTCQCFVAMYRYCYLFRTLLKYIELYFPTHCIYKLLLVSLVLSSAHPWVRSVIAVVVTAEALGSTTDWVPPVRCRHVSRFPGLSATVYVHVYVCVFVISLVSLCAFSLQCMENEKRCVGTFCGPESPCVDGEFNMHHWFLCVCSEVIEIQNHFYVTVISFAMLQCNFL